MHHDDAHRNRVFHPTAHGHHGSRDKTVRFWDVPAPMAGDDAHVRRWSR